MKRALRFTRIGKPLGPALEALGITDGAGFTTVTKLLALLGLDLSDPLNLSNLDVPGLNLITTAGPPFTLLKLLGLDLGWVPGLPNSVADEVNNRTQFSPRKRRLRSNGRVGRGCGS